MASGDGAMGGEEGGGGGGHHDGKRAGLEHHKADAGGGASLVPELESAVRALDRNVKPLC